MKLIEEIRNQWINFRMFFFYLSFSVIFAHKFSWMWEYFPEGLNSGNRI